MCNEHGFFLSFSIRQLGSRGDGALPSLCAFKGPLRLQGGCRSIAASELAERAMVVAIDRSSPAEKNR
jgi:hypothetical protein